MGKSLRPSERGGERGDGARKTTRAEKTEDVKTRERMREHLRRANGKVTETGE